MMAARSLSMALLAACLFVMLVVKVDAVPGTRQLLGETNDDNSSHPPPLTCKNTDCPDKNSDCLEEGVCHCNNYCSHQTGGYCETNCKAPGISCFYKYKNSQTVCRPASNDKKCQGPAYCTGNSKICPANGYLPSTTVCRASCGTCDKEEYCTGHSYDCPLDVVLPKNTPCGKAKKLCELPPACDGHTGYCPSTGEPVPRRQRKLCGEPMGPCDKAEYCTGYSLDCPEQKYECVRQGGASPNDFRCTAGNNHPRLF